MSLSISGQSRVPPGFRFRPTEEELLHYYLRKKVSNEKIDMDVILEIDINKLEPWDIEETCKIGSTPQNEWYFFSRKDKKYPMGIRTNRATDAGFWKATGRDKIIRSNSKRIGMRKTLVFYLGRAPNGQKSDWIMYEFRLEENISPNSQFNGSSSSGLTPEEDGWVVCRVCKKKNLLKTLESTKLSSLANNVGTQMLHSSRDGALDEILQYMRKSCKMETEPNNPTNNNMNHLPALSNEVQVIAPSTHQRSDSSSPDQVIQKDLDFSDWDTVDRLVASQLQSDSFTQLDFNDNSNLSLLSISDQEDLLHTNDCNIHVDLWNFTL